MKAIYQYDNDGSIIIKTAAGTTHRFASASEAVNWCKRNNVDAYPLGTTKDQAER